METDKGNNHNSTRTTTDALRIRTNTQYPARKKAMEWWSVLALCSSS